LAPRTAVGITVARVWAAIRKIPIATSKAGLDIGIPTNIASSGTWIERALTVVDV
jgi:hypothetical protein